MRLIFYLLLPLLLLTCGGGEASGPGGGGGPGGPPQATPVRVVEAQEEQLVFYNSYPGTVSPLERVDVRPQLGGYVTAVHFQEGDYVSRGQKLYTIDVRRYAADVNQAEASIESAEANLDLAERNVVRYRRLNEAEAIATQTLDQAEAELRSRRQDLRQAQAALESAETQLDYTVIRAPLSGRTELSSVKVGTQVSPGNPVMTTITQLEPIGVDFNLPQTEIPRLAEFELMTLADLDSTFRLRLPDGSVYDRYGSVYASDQAVDPRTGSLTVRLRFDNDQGMLRNGMNVSVELLNRQSGQQLVVPAEALSEQMGEFYVYQIQDSTALRRKVKTGDRIGGQRIIQAGIKAGDRIAVEGLKGLKDSTKVRVVPSMPSGQSPQG